MDENIVLVSGRMVSVTKGSLVLVFVWMVSTMKENVVLVSRFSWVMVSSPSPTRSPRAHPTSCRSCPTCWPTWRRRSPLFSWGQRWVSDLYCVQVVSYLLAHLDNIPLFSLGQRWVSDLCCVQVLS